MSERISAPTSNVINFLKCILCVGVVCIHSGFDENSVGVYGHDLGVFYGFHKVFVMTFLDKTCVPVFFVISGYLYFNNIDSFSFLEYRKKTISRLRSLLLPFLIANILFFIGGIIVRGFGNENIFSSCADALYGWKEGFPSDPPLWYMRDLMVVCFIFTPVIYFLTRKASFLFPILLIILWVFDFWYTSFPGFELKPFFFFSLGAFMGIKKYDMISLIQIPKWGVFYILLFLVLLFVVCIWQIDVMDRIAVLLSIPFWMSLAYWMASLGIKCPLPIVSATVFIYIYHYYLAIAIPRGVLVLVGFSIPLSFFAFFSGVISTIVIMTILYFVLRKFTPRLLSLMIGNR